jgi:hypothetical protein
VEKIVFLYQSWLNWKKGIQTEEPIKDFYLVEATSSSISFLQKFAALIESKIAIVTKTEEFTILDKEFIGVESNYGGLAVRI